MIDTIHSSYVYAADSDNFKALVLDNSHRGPVLVNFWSRKAGPCLRQYPVLDQLIHEYAGRVLLVNVDTETEFVYTREYAVTSVPLLKLFRHGQVVHTWRGFQNEKELRTVLDRHVVRDSDLALAEAVRSYADGRTSEAYAMLAEAIIDDPHNPRLPLTMCKLLKHEQRFAEALSLIDSLPDEMRSVSDIQQFEQILLFCQEADLHADISQLLAQLQAQPDDLGAREQLVAHYVMQQQYDFALHELSIVMEIDMHYRDDYPRRTMLRIIKILGDTHPLASQYRDSLMRYTH